MNRKLRAVMSRKGHTGPATCLGIYERLREDVESMLPTYQALHPDANVWLWDIDDATVNFRLMSMDERTYWPDYEPVPDRVYAIMGRSNGNFLNSGYSWVVTVASTVEQAESALRSQRKADSGTSIYWIWQTTNREVERFVRQRA